MGGETSFSLAGCTYAIVYNILKPNLKMLPLFN